MQSLRGVTLPDANVLSLLQSSFVVGWTNIQKADHVGLSHGYRSDQTAVGTTNGAGGRNLQLLVLAADGTVLHALPGFWHPDDLVGELEFALVVAKLWASTDLDRRGKERMYAVLHRAHVRGFSRATIARSEWQSFDAHAELGRYARGPRDTVALDRDGHPALAPLCTVVHRRLAAQPFRALEAFDLEAVVDYGRPFYDNNHGDKGRDFRAAAITHARRAKAQAKAEAALQRLAR